MKTVSPQGDWRPYRAAIEAAYREMGEDVPTSIPARDWNLFVLAAQHMREGQKYHCAECSQALEPGTEIRCLDCKAPLCERCAPHHFWPNGRPSEGGER